MCTTINTLQSYVATGNRLVVAVSSLLWYPTSDGCASAGATVEHVAHARLLLAPTITMSCLTLVDHCYRGTCGTRAGATSAHISDELSDISRPLLLWSTWHTRRCY
jgi:hypothetical protein